MGFSKPKSLTRNFHRVMGKQPAAKAASSAKKKKSWAGGSRRKEKNVRDVFIIKKEYQKMKQQIAKMKIITVNTVMNRFNICGSLVRAIVREMRAAGQIKLVGPEHSKMWL